MSERNILSEKRNVKIYLEAPLALNQIWFTIDTTWWKKWKKYVNYSNNEQSVIEHESPGPIDNSALLEKECFNSNSLVEFDYEIVPETVWKMLTESYGFRQTDATLFKRFVIKEGTELRVELFPLRLNIFIYGDDTKSNVTVKEFSCLSKLVDVQKFVQTACDIPEGAVYQVIQEYDNGSLHVIHYASETTTLSDAGFRIDQKLYIDLRNSDGEFSFKENRANYNNSKGSVRGGSSSDLFIPQSSSASSSMPFFKIEEKNSESNFRPGVCGLANLGNTCFMNSAIQCISNVPPITNYFLNDNWSVYLNKDNPLGMGGRIATAYANLIREMWSGTTAYSLPRDFKYEVAQFAPQFCGYSQHDSQELMMFLLDGLHEDLNRVTNKPYIEQKHSANQPDNTVADENWQYHLKRNNSIIVDYFHGQLKSKVVCPDCNFVSVTFDPFACLSLPLRHSYYQSVIFYPIDPMSPITNLSISLYKNSPVEMLRDIVEKHVDFNHNNELLISQVRKFKMQRFLQDNENLSNIPSDDQIVVYEVAPLESDHYYVDVVFKERYISSNLALPLIIQIYKKVNWQRFMIAIKPHLPRFLNQTILETDVDSFYTNGGDRIDFIDTQLSNDDNADNSDYDRSESVSTSSVESAVKSVSNPFENVFSVVLLETHTNSTNEHEINPLSRTRLLKFDGNQHIIIEWTLEGLKFSKDSDTTRITCNQQMPKPTVEDCLQQFLSEEFLGQKDLWFCPKCKSDKAASKKLDIWRLPKILVLHLKRFKATSYFGDKINSEVLFPIRDLNLSKYVPNAKSDNEYEYDLVAVSNHVGCLAGGHYFAYAKNCVNNCWYKFDDSTTTVVDENEIVTKSAYVLVYVARSCANNNYIDYNHNASSDMDVDIDEPE